MELQEELVEQVQHLLLARQTEQVQEKEVLVVLTLLEEMPLLQLDLVVVLMEVQLQ